MDEPKPEETSKTRERPEQPQVEVDLEDLIVLGVTQAIARSARKRQLRGFIAKP
jgi:hypothetical protein